MRSFQFILPIALVMGCVSEPTARFVSARTDICSDQPISASAIWLDIVAPSSTVAANKWCWVRSIAMVGNYFDRTIAPCRLAEVTLGPEGANCCTEPYANAICDRSGYPGDTEFALNFLGLWHKPVPQALDESDIQFEISNGRPILVHLDGKKFGHMIAIVGFAPTRDGTMLYRVYDPNDRSSFHSIAYAEFFAYKVQSAMLEWKYSWIHIMPRPLGCQTNYIDNPSCGCRLKE